MRTRILMTGLSVGLFLAAAAGTSEDARAQAATNTAVTTNVAPVPAMPPGLQLPKISPQTPTNDDDNADNNSPAQEITAIPPAQTNVPPPSSQLPQPQANPPAAVKSPTSPVPVSAPSPQPPPAPAAEAETIDFQFQGAPVSAILEWYARLTGKSIIAAPTLAGVINFRSQSKLTRSDALQALDSVLAINGIAAIPLGDKFLKVVQIATAKQEGLPVGKVTAPADTLGTQIIPLKYADAAEVIAVLQPYLHPYGQLVPLQKSNSILISETAANLKQMMEIVSYVDQPSMLRMEIHSYILVHAKSSDVMARLTAIIQGAEAAGGHAAVQGQPGQPVPVPGQVRRPGPPGQPGAAPDEESVVEGKVIMAADERTNKIFILTRPSNFGFFDKLIAELDAKVEPDVVMKVIELNYAAAEDVASLVNSLITGSSPAAPSSSRRTSSSGTTTTGARPPSIPPPPSGGGSAGSGVDTGFLQYAEGVRLLPDPRTNSLLVMATKEDMARIEQLVRSIDTSVAQVQIEVVIAELTLNNELDVGVDMFKRLFNAGQTSQTGGNSTDANVPVQLSSVSSNLPTAAALASGAGGLTWFQTYRNLGLDTVIHALASSANSKVLSTPVIQTMDNQEADITVGESVPVPTSQTSSLINGVGTLATAGVTSSIQYQDVAIELKVTPRINPDGYVRMDVEQKVNDLGPNVNIGGTIVPTILKREAKSSLAVEDKSTIVLGGLIQQTKSLTTTKTPFFGDIPFFGQIFKSQANNKQRTELIIFIRPTVLRTDTAAVAEARRRLKLLGVSEELEHHYFPDSNTTTNSSKNDSTAPAPAYRTTVVEPQAPVENPTDRQSTKVKALKLEDGDITPQ